LTREEARCYKRICPDIRPQAVTHGRDLSDVVLAGYRTNTSFVVDDEDNNELRLVI
jgi:hypothetical protein